MQGVVASNDDPEQMCRLRIWIPAIDGENYIVDNLPWAEYSSPMMGFTTDYSVGRERTKRSGLAAYGFMAVPKVGALVLVLFLNGDPNRRFYIASVPALHTNRSLPGGRNKNPETGATGPWTDTYAPHEPAYTNMRAAFGDVNKSESITRGVYERQGAEAATEKTGKEGYTANTVDSKHLDPQTYTMVTPGGHYITMQDDPEWCRLRLRTVAGNQIILDDTNERIYISTARGGSWIELDEDGHIHMYANESFSVSAGGDMNFTAKGSFNVAAGDSINLKASKDIMLDCDGDFNISTAGSILGTACKTTNLFSVGPMILSGKPLHFNGPPPLKAQPAADPQIQPAHEPWTRPGSPIQRNPYWKA